MKSNPLLQIKTGEYDLMAFRRYLILYSISCITFFYCDSSMNTLIIEISCIEIIEISVQAIPFAGSAILIRCIAVVVSKPNYKKKEHSFQFPTGVTKWFRCIRVVHNV